VGVPEGSGGVGFNGGYPGFFAPLRTEAALIVDVADPDHASAEERRRERHAREDAQFSEDHYMSVPRARWAAPPAAVTDVGRRADGRVGRRLGPI
jgi:hypothetical protein